MTKKEWRTAILALAILGLCGATYFLTKDSYVPSAVQTTIVEEKRHDDVSAYVEAQAILSRYLKSPSTAVFPSMSNARIERLAGDGFKVSSYVDAQNSFGVPIRSDWEMVFQFIEDKVDISIVVMDGEFLYKKDTVN
jgi:hypothetical protein